MNLKSLCCLFAMAAAVSSPAWSQDLAVVNGKKIPQALFDDALSDAFAEGQADTPELRTYLKEQLIDLEILSQEADKQGIGKREDVIQQVDQARKSIIVRAMVAEYLEKNPVSDGDIQVEYDKQKIQAGENEYNVRHILVETEDEAKGIIDKLKKGAAFEELAAQSKDPGSAANGGSLDWAPATLYVQPFSDALKALKKGELTKVPVKTQYGYHVIRLEDTRPLQFPSLDDLKPRITEGLKRSKFMAFLGNLRSKAKIQ